MDDKTMLETLRGMSCNAYDVFGAHFSNEFNQHGVRFSVYAPNAKRILLIGDFNDWNGYDMERLPCGVWTIFVKDVKEMALYKYRIFTSNGEIHDRIDPFAFYSEVRPDTASIVYNIDNFNWSDCQWMESRTKNYNKPLSIYEIHNGSWRIKNLSGDKRFYSYNELVDVLIPYVKQMGYTHIEMLPITEYPFDGSWGYQVTGYYSPTSRYGTPKDLMNFIDNCHKQSIGVIMDFVPAHFVKDFYALHIYDGSFIYESDFENKRFSEWGTALFDFTKPYVLSFMKSAINFWLCYYHFDGVRYDAVSNLIYDSSGLNDAGIWFLKNTNYAINLIHPNVMLIAEDSTDYLKGTAPVVYGGLGFDYKWNLRWMHDILNYLSAPPYRRDKLKSNILASLDYFYNDIYILPFSHDEVTHGKKTIIDKLYGSYEQKFAQLRSLYLFMFTYPGKKLNFMGNELAEFKEWNENEELGWNLLDYSNHKAFNEYMKVLHQIYSKEVALFEADFDMRSFNWIDKADRYSCVFAYERNNLSESKIYAIFNFSDKDISYKLEVKQSGKYKEVINTNSIEFGGDGNINVQIDAFIESNKIYITLNLSAFSSILIRKEV